MATLQAAVPGCAPPAARPAAALLHASTTLGRGPWQDHLELKAESGIRGEEAGPPTTAASTVSPSLSEQVAAAASRE
jgi:hypothetical protein